MINLVKGQKIDLTKTNPTVKNFKVGLGWKPNTTSSGSPYDIDVSAFVLGADGKRLSDSHFVFYNNLKTPDEAVVHNGDNRTGDGDGDDETLSIDFSKMLPTAEKVIFVVTIHDAISLNQNFGQINGSYIRIYDGDTNTDILKYDLGEDFSIETALEFGNLYKNNGEWKFNAVGTGMKGGLSDYLNQY